MDPPKSTYDFSVVSPLILELIINYLSGYDIMALYRTHSSALFMRMRFGGVRRLEIARLESEPSWHYSSFGALTHFSRMHTLSLTNPMLPVFRRGWTLLESLPPSVTSITLTLPMELGSWLLISKDSWKKTRIFENSSDRYKRAPVLKVVENFPDYKIASRLPNLNSFCVGLSRLKTDLVRELLIYSQKSSIQAVQLFAESCPTSLTRLEIPQTSPDFTKLNLPFMAHIGVHYTDDEDLVLDQKDWARLPSELQHFKLEIDNAAIATLQGLPASLQTLEFAKGFGDWNSGILDGLVGQRLTSMTVDMRKSKCAGSFIWQLPATLESFKLNAIEAPEVIYKDLPVNLTELVIDVNRAFFPAPPFILPPKLLHLSLRHCFALYYDDFVALPRTLETFTLSLETATYLGRSPPNPPSNSSAALPESLRALRITRSNFTAEFAEGLPSGLTFLEFITTQTLHATALHSLPPTLTELIIDTSRTMHDSALEALPASLTKLTVIAGSQVGRRVVSLLPRSLLHLAIHNNTYLNDDCVSELPPNLRTLELPHNDKLTVACASQLPKSLNVLIVLRIIMTFPSPPKAELMSSFPTFLKVYELPWYTKKNRKFDLFAMKS